MLAAEENFLKSTISGPRCLMCGMNSSEIQESSTISVTFLFWRVERRTSGYTVYEQLPQTATYLTSLTLYPSLYASANLALFWVSLDNPEKFSDGRLGAFDYKTSEFVQTGPFAMSDLAVRLEPLSIAFPNSWYTFALVKSHSEMLMCESLGIRVIKRLKSESSKASYAHEVTLTSWSASKLQSRSSCLTPSIMVNWRGLSSKTISTLWLGPNIRPLQTIKSFS